jgi:protein gp37
MHPEILSLPSRWKKPRRIFVNSMSDLFHEGVSVRFIREVFFKQWGGWNKKARGRLFDGRMWQEYPGGALARRS